MKQTDTWNKLEKGEIIEVALRTVGVCHMALAHPSALSSVYKNTTHCVLSSPEHTVAIYETRQPVLQGGHLDRTNRIPRGSIVILYDGVWYKKRKRK